MLKRDNYLLFKLILTTVLGAVCLYYLFSVGILVPAFLADKAHMPFLIAAVFVYGLLSNFWFALNIVSSDIKIRFEYVRDIGDYLVTLGLIGTSIGLLAIVGIDWTALGTPEGLQSIGKALKLGLQTLTYNTIIASVAWIWHAFNTRLVTTQIEIQNPE